MTIFNHENLKICVTEKEPVLSEQDILEQVPKGRSLSDHYVNLGQTLLEKLNYLGRSHELNFPGKARFFDKSGRKYL